ncbi:metal ABC transporter solute-binding protein, Zn/Mn family [uncultured Ilyobacter sp.]|uniref:metal ABC transporter substrate-binding protein n=1 Tax=uncultured Ilyobacter sp. TaxID=544433 RepID=UPI002AA83492|nr:zinc ABC transporter substrate-binding protein [uncultured Ilyobacter sp.]
MIRFFITILFTLIFTVISFGENIKVIATIFPNYDFARNIGKEKAKVTLLLPPGVEAHSYEPTPRDMVRITTSDILLYTGEDMEPWVHRLGGNLPSSVTVSDISQGIEKIKDDDHDHTDPHIWTDPILAMQMVDNVAAAFAEADPKNSEFYIENAKIYKNKLFKLHQKIERELSDIDKRSLVFSGHMVFGYFAKRYNLTFLTPYRSFSPDAEPTPKRMAELITTIKKRGDSYIYFEELIDPKSAKLIASETQTKILLLHGAHNLSKEEFKSGKGYIDIMEDNLKNLKRGLKNE